MNKLWINKLLISIMVVFLVLSAIHFQPLPQIGTERALAAPYGQVANFAVGVLTVP